MILVVVTGWLPKRLDIGIEGTATPRESVGSFPRHVETRSHSYSSLSSSSGRM